MATWRLAERMASARQKEKVRKHPVHPLTRTHWVFSVNVRITMVPCGEGMSPCGDVRINAHARMKAPDPRSYYEAGQPDRLSSAEPGHRQPIEAIRASPIYEKQAPSPGWPGMDPSILAERGASAIQKKNRPKTDIDL